jgi:hypothetical protein
VKPLIAAPLSFSLCLPCFHRPSSFCSQIRVKNPTLIFVMVDFQAIMMEVCVSNMRNLEPLLLMFGVRSSSHVGFSGFVITRFAIHCEVLPWCAFVFFFSKLPDKEISSFDFRFFKWDNCAGFADATLLECMIRPNYQLGDYTGSYPLLFQSHLRLTYWDEIRGFLSFFFLKLVLMIKNICFVFSITEFKRGV